MGRAKQIVLTKQGYMVKGFSDLSMRGGGNGCIPMKPFKVQTIDKKTLFKNINDNGFGVENINGAICDIYEDYEGTLRFFKTVTVGTVSDHTIKCYEQGEG